MNKFLVIWCLHNYKNNGWAYKIEGAFDDYIDAFNKYAEVCKTYIRNNGDFDKVTVMIIDTSDNMHEFKSVDIPHEPLPDENEGE